MGGGGRSPGSRHEQVRRRGGPAEPRSPGRASRSRRWKYSPHALIDRHLWINRPTRPIPAGASLPVERLFSCCFRSAESAPDEACRSTSLYRPDTEFPKGSGVGPLFGRRHAALGLSPSPGFGLGVGLRPPRRTPCRGDARDRCTGRLRSSGLADAEEERFAAADGRPLSLVVMPESRVRGARTCPPLGAARMIQWSTFRWLTRHALV
jgi:hypothetical protein